MSRSTRLFGSIAQKLLCGSSKNIVDIAVNEAIVMFNEGMTGRIKIMKALGFKIGHFTVISAFKASYARIKNADITSKSYTLEARRASRIRKKATKEHFAELEDKRGAAFFSFLSGAAKLVEPDLVGGQMCEKQILSLTLEKLTVWCALWAGGIIGPYFFKNDAGHNVTVNGNRYRAMITIFFIPELYNHDVQELWFQQDGATCHTARATIDLLKDTFGARVISRFGPVNWPPRSCDLTPLDYFLWGYVKSLV
ncbi:uncharacterized protein TNCV_3237311 [Trichonephila clavipes]|nr:uncharacterized protein TNCV_3237311 [Trichonephila clavipes]